jgi:hypothetical protein
LQAVLVVELTTQVAVEQVVIELQLYRFQGVLLIQLQLVVLEQAVLVDLVIEELMVQPVNLLVLVQQAVAAAVAEAEVLVLLADQVVAVAGVAEMKDTETLLMQAKVIEVAKQLTYMELAEVVPAVKVVIDPDLAVEPVDRQRIVA